MAVKRVFLGLGVGAVLATSTAAFAAEAAATKPVSAYAIGNRASTVLNGKKKSHLQEVGDRTDLSDGRYVVLGLGTLVVAGGFIIALDDDDADNYRADSPGG